MRLARIGNNNLVKLGKNESISSSIIYKICLALDYNISDLIEIKKSVFKSALFYNLRFYNNIEYLLQK